MNGEPEPIGADERGALEQVLADLRAERDRVAATLRDPDSVGDPADQADELQRASDVARMDTRIEDISVRLREAAGAGSPRTDAVGVGSTVTLRFSDGTTETVQITEVADEAERTAVTADSPLGRALLGRGPGEAVQYDTPRGAAEATVVSIGG
ncbi:GreA/GreB family elongation factor [Kitasatospora sp. DSM 101779]|uniref:GreA/GreB family elongation factor n=1 Tax=Kitasatospora sp. DSM 101779 TaxID=2853165 RepID=UPI0021D9D5DB|nr:GreA/GreB family elongation factor [Kitasatospora sp. DSM 101779]MCU7827090.1 GreA/GreB family elongation factor [Kitasatospora sp. DSM 101779]